jgi:hypothetical protein
MIISFSDIAVIQVQLRDSIWNLGVPGHRFFMLVDGSDGPANALECLSQEGCNAVLLETVPATGIITHMGIERYARSLDCIVTGCRALFIHSDAVAWAISVPDEVALQPHDDLHALLDPRETGAIDFGAHTRVREFLLARTKGEIA